VTTAYLQNEHRTKKSEHLEAHLVNRYLESEYLEVNMYLAKNECSENKYLAMNKHLVNSLKIKHLMMNLCLVSGYLEIEYLEIEYLEIEYLATNANLMKNEHLEA
jgi:hypothetical protein